MSSKNSVRSAWRGWGRAFGWVGWWWRLLTRGGGFDLETMSVDVGRHYFGQGEYQICVLSAGTIEWRSVLSPNLTAAAPSWPLIQILPDYTGPG